MKFSIKGWVKNHLFLKPFLIIISIYAGTVEILLQLRIFNEFYSNLLQYCFKKLTLNLEWCTDWQNITVLRRWNK